MKERFDERTLAQSSADLYQSKLRLIFRLIFLSVVIKFLPPASVEERMGDVIKCASIEVLSASSVLRDVWKIFPPTFRVIQSDVITARDPLPSDGGVSKASKSSSKKNSFECCNKDPDEVDTDGTIRGLARLIDPGLELQLGASILCVHSHNTSSHFFLSLFLRTRINIFFLYLSLFLSLFFLFLFYLLYGYTIFDFTLFAFFWVSYSKEIV